MLCINMLIFAHNLGNWLIVPLKTMIFYRAYQTMTSPGRQAGYGLLNAVRGRSQRPALEETGRQVAYCKHTAPGSLNRLTRAVTAAHDDDDEWICRTRHK